MGGGADVQREEVVPVDVLASLEGLVGGAGWWWWLMVALSSAKVAPDWGDLDRGDVSEKISLEIQWAQLENVCRVGRS